jgi:hypothetical protein
MNASTAIALKLGADTLIRLWAILENKPEGWKPTEKDWDDLDTEALNATPEQRLMLAQIRAAQFPPK